MVYRWRIQLVGGMVSRWWSRAEGFGVHTEMGSGSYAGVYVKQFLDSGRGDRTTYRIVQRNRNVLVALPIEGV
jgi:hypothetical protein